jgi:hypothetical protein
MPEQEEERDQPPVDKSTTPTPEGIYIATATSLLTGLLKLAESQVTYLTSQIALIRLSTADPPICTDGADSRLIELVEELKAIDYPHFDSYRYVGNISLLVYGTAIFDTFLTDTTTFLFVLHPAALV